MVMKTGKIRIAAWLTACFLLLCCAAGAEATLKETTRGGKVVRLEWQDENGAMTTGPEGYAYAFYPGYTTDIKNVVMAFNNRPSVNLTFTDYDENGNPTQEYHHSFDFSGRNGRIILSHHGHWHSSFELDIDGMPVILSGSATNATPSSRYQPVVGKEDVYIIPDRQTAIDIHANGYGYEFRYPADRELGTLKEAQFDVVSVNSNAINILNVGAGADRVINKQ